MARGERTGRTEGRGWAGLSDQHPCMHHGQGSSTFDAAHQLAAVNLPDIPSSTNTEHTPWYESIVMRITLVFALLLVGVVVLMGWISWRASRTELIAQAHRAIAQTLDVAESRLLTGDRAMRQNLDILVTNSAMEDWCAQADTTDPLGRERAREQVATFIEPMIRSRTRFSQIRLIGADPEGTEVVRVDRSTGEVVRTPDSLLQAKGDRGYYRATMAAGKGARLSFPIDLNREHASLDRPFVPTLRVAAPLFSPQGKRAGMVIINSDMRPIFDELQAMADSGQVLMLARADGEVVLHRDTALTFRFEQGGSKKMLDILPPTERADPDPEILVGYRSFTLGPSADRYTVAITQPMNGLLGTLRAKRNGLTLLFAAIALAAILLMALFAYNVRARLNRLTGLIERYAVGSTEELPMGRRDEFGRMARGLRTMQERIDARVRELELARGKAEDSDRQRRELLANMSHEVRTPLNAIIGMSDGVDITGMGPGDQQKLAVVRRSAQRLKGLVDDLLTHSRIGEGKLALHYSSVDVRTLMQDILTAQLPAANAKGLRMRIELKDLPQLVRTDGLRLHQVIDNLVGNAVRFTDSGEVVIAADVMDSKILRLLVWDTGQGIPLEAQQRIFERFERATGSEQEDGAGLGLAITKRVVDLLGGTIELESTSGKGSRFMVRIPIETATATAPAAVLATVPAPDTSGLRILYVEDVFTNRMLVQEWAGIWGWKLTMAETGEDAIAVCERDRFDLLLIDLGLGQGMSGLELAEKLRGKGPDRYTPMIALTAYADDGEDEEALTAGMNDRVTKPVDRNVLLRSVAFWCERSPAEEEQPNLSMLVGHYDHDTEKLQSVYAQYRTEFIQRRLSLRAALRSGDEQALTEVRHALRPHWQLLGLHHSVTDLDAMTMHSGECDNTAVIEDTFRRCDRAFLNALRAGVTAV